ncbi:MAG: carbamoyltransferase N-terminal domain-containing protein [Cyanobacteriota bacterium]|nr:carbamoyltransferase N-terminal domain-containing protein [Cyanobacteriota bacterium]
MNILGLGYTQHECSAALVVDGTLRTAIARERVSRIKRDGSAWGSARLDLGSAIHYCLEANKIRLDDIDLIVYHDYFHRSAADFRSRLADEGGLDLFALPSIALPHHFAHACCSFYLSPFDQAAIFVTDGAGGKAEGIASNCSGPEAESIANGSTLIQNIDQDTGQTASEYESFYHFNAGQWKCLRKTIGKSNGVGAVYSRASLLLFGDDLDCGKTMGLSSYVPPASQSMFLTKAGPQEMPFFRGQLPTVLQDLEKRIEGIMAVNPGPEKYDATELQFYAASLQKETEDALVEYAQWLQKTTGSKNLLDYPARSAKGRPRP